MERMGEALGDMARIAAAFVIGQGLAKQQGLLSELSREAKRKAAD